MKRQIRLVTILILLLLLINGCTEMTNQEKNVCTKLSGKSYAFVPNCETEKSCFEKVSEMFKTNFSYEEESILYEVKNSVARSWYFYNSAQKEQKEIQKACKNKDPLSAVKAINNTQDLIEDSFYELDKGMKKSFEFIKLKEMNLSRNKVDLLKEKEIYQNLIELRQIISELNSGATNSETYVSYYSKKAEAFAKSSASKGFSILVEKSPFWIKQFDFIDNTPLSELKIGEKNYFPFAKNILKEVTNQAEIAFFKKQSIIALQNFPFYEFMQLYSNLGGNNNSALKRFSDLVNRTSENQTKLEKEIVLNLKECESKIVQINELLKKEKEANSFKDLSDKLLEKIITSDTNLAAQIEQAKKEFIEIKNKKYNSNLTKGEELEKLIKLNLILNELYYALSFKTEGITERLILICKEKAEEDLPEIKDMTNLNAKKILEDVKYYSSRVKNTQSRECLLSCREMVSKKELFEKSNQNILQLEALAKDSAKECMLFLENILNKENLYELKLEFENLKKEEITKENINSFFEKCNLIKKQAEKELKTQEDYLNLLKEYKKLKSNLIKLEEVTSNLNEKELTKVFEEYYTKAKTFEEYFTNEEINYEKIGGIKEEVLEKIKIINTNLEEEIRKNIIYYAEKNISFSILNSQIIYANTPTKSKISLIINNPFEKIDGPIYFKVDRNLSEVLHKEESVETILDKTIKMNYLPLGKTVIDFLEETTFFTEEKDSFIYITNKLSLMKREIKITPQLNAQKVLIKTLLPKNTTKTIVLENNKEILYANEKEELKFVIENLKSDSKIEIFYYLIDLITISKSIEDKKATTTEEMIKYKITAQNNLPSKINATLYLQLPSTNAEVTLYSQDYKEMKTYSTDEGIAIQNESFFEKETKQFTLLVKTSNLIEYYKEGLSKQKDFFEENNYSKKVEEIIEVIQKEELDKMQSLFELNLIEIEKIKKEKNSKIEQELLKQKILEKIEELRKKQNELTNLGLTAEAKKIEETINLVLETGFDEEKEIAKSFDKLVNLLFSSDNKIKEEVDRMWVEINSKSQMDPSLILLKNNFSDKKQLFEENFYFDPIKTNSLFLELKEDYTSFLNLLKNIDKNRLLKEKEVQKRLNSDLNYCINTLISLEQELIQNNSRLIKAKFIIPLSKERMQKLKLILNEINNSNASYEEKIKQIEPLKDEIWDAEESIKKQSILAFNNAIDNKASKEVLLDGKTLLDQNRYIDAYLVLADFKGISKDFFDFQLFLPIIIIILIALVLKSRIQNKENEEKMKKEELLKNWEKI